MKLMARDLRILVLNGLENVKKTCLLEINDDSFRTPILSLFFDYKLIP